MTDTGQKVRARMSVSESGDKRTLPEDSNDDDVPSYAIESSIIDDTTQYQDFFVEKNLGLDRATQPRVSFPISSRSREVKAFETELPGIKKWLKDQKITWTSIGCVGRSTYGTNEKIKSTIIITVPRKKPENMIRSWPCKMSGTTFELGIEVLVGEIKPDFGLGFKERTDPVLCGSSCGNTNELRYSGTIGGFISLDLDAESQEKATTFAVSNHHVFAPGRVPGIRCGGDGLLDRIRQLLFPLVDNNKQISNDECLRKWTEIAMSFQDDIDLCLLLSAVGVLDKHRKDETDFDSQQATYFAAILLWLSFCEKIGELGQKYDVDYNQMILENFREKLSGELKLLVELSQQRDDTSPWPSSSSHSPRVFTEGIQRRIQGRIWIQQGLEDRYPLSLEYMKTAVKEYGRYPWGEPSFNEIFTHRCNSYMADDQLPYLIVNLFFNGDQRRNHNSATPHELVSSIESPVVGSRPDCSDIYRFKQYFGTWLRAWDHRTELRRLACAFVEHPSTRDRRSLQSKLGSQLEEHRAFLNQLRSEEWTKVLSTMGPKISETLRQSLSARTEQQIQMAEQELERISDPIRSTIGTLWASSGICAHQDPLRMKPFPNNVKEREDWALVRLWPSVNVQNWFRINPLGPDPWGRGQEFLGVRSWRADSDIDRIKVFKCGRASDHTIGIVSGGRRILDDEDGSSIASYEIYPSSSSMCNFSEAGDSGSWIMDSHGLLVGMVWGKNVAEGSTLFTPADYFFRFIRNRIQREYGTDRPLDTFKPRIVVASTANEPEAAIPSPPTDPPHV